MERRDERLAIFAMRLQIASIAPMPGGVALAMCVGSHSRRSRSCWAAAPPSPTLLHLIFYSNDPQTSGPLPRRTSANRLHQSFCKIVMLCAFYKMRSNTRKLVTTLYHTIWSIAFLFEVKQIVHGNGVILNASHFRNRYNAPLTVSHTRNLHDKVNRRSEICVLIVLVGIVC